MAKFAELNSNNVVIRVLAVDNSVIINSQNVEDEQLGIVYLKNLYGQNTIWKQTSINTFGGIYYLPNVQPDAHIPSPDQHKALRKNYANIGYTYDPNRDAFYAPRPSPSWTLNELTCLWEAPA
jgi:hypothetical protein